MFFYEEGTVLSSSAYKILRNSKSTPPALPASLPMQAEILFIPAVEGSEWSTNAGGN